MKFVSLHLNNWLPYKGEQCLEFPMDDHRNILVIFGENMNGKTSLLNAVRWALYGKARNRQKRVIADKDLMNIDALKNGEDSFWVKLAIKADGHEYLIERRVTLKDGLAKPIVILKRDNRVVDGNLVEGLINGLVAEQISQFLLFDGELLNEFEDLVVNEGGEQAKLIKTNIEKALGLPVLTRAASEIETLSKKFAKKAQEEISKNNSMKVLARNLATHNDNLTSKEEERDKLEKDLGEHREKLQELDEQIERSSKNMEMAGKKAALKDEQARNLEEITEATRLSKLKMAHLWKVPLSIALEPVKNSIQKKVAELTGIQQSNAVVRSKIIALEKSINEEICSQCGFGLAESQREAVNEKLKNLREEIAEIANLEEELSQLQQSLGGITMKNGALDIAANLSELSRTIQTKLFRNAKIDSDLFDIQNELLGFDEEKGRRLKNEYDNRNKEVGIILNKLDVVELDLKDIQLEIDSIKKNPLYKNAITGESKEEHDKIEGLKVIFNAAVNNYRDSMKDEVGARASHSFENLTTEERFDELKINSSYGLELVIDGQKVARSAGAEQIVALSLIESLNFLGRRKGPMLMDTPAGRLDKSHRSNVMSYLPSVVTQLAIFAHSGELTEDEIYFDRSRIGKKYRINRVSPFHSILEEA